MSRSATRKKFYSAVLASVAYFVFLTSSTPHRVHHLFDGASRTHGAVTGAHAHTSTTSSHSTHRHDHDVGSRGHAGDPADHESTPKKDCTHLAAFQQHPTSITEVVPHATSEIVVQHDFEPAPVRKSATHLAAQRPRSPPKFSPATR